MNNSKKRATKIKICTPFIYVIPHGYSYYYYYELIYFLVK